MDSPQSTFVERRASRTLSTFVEQEAPLSVIKSLRPQAFFHRQKEEKVWDRIGQEVGKRCRGCKYCTDCGWVVRERAKKWICLCSVVRFFRCVLCDLSDLNRLCSTEVQFVSLCVGQRCMSQASNFVVRLWVCFAIVNVCWFRGV